MLLEEEVGFEPTEDAIHVLSSFQDWRHKPLGHSSVILSLQLARGPRFERG